MQLADHSLDPTLSRLLFQLFTHCDAFCGAWSMAITFSGQPARSRYAVVHALANLQRRTTTISVLIKGGRKCISAHRWHTNDTNVFPFQSEYRTGCWGGNTNIILSRHVLRIAQRTQFSSVQEADPDRCVPFSCFP